MTMGKLQFNMPMTLKVVREPLVEGFIKTADGKEKRCRVRGPSDIHNMLKAHMADLTGEEFWVLSLDTAGGVTGAYMVSRGGLSSSIVEPRTIFAFAVMQMAAAVVCVHNHPSGNPEPSAEDIAVTRQLVEAGRVMGIPLRDHVIIAGDGFTSLAERGCV
jgi:DNA repair protein RadC